MTEETFWQIIKDSELKSNGDLDTQLEILQTKLELLSPDEIISLRNKYLWTTHKNKQLKRLD